jgi:hypothetical protein
MLERLSIPPVAPAAAEDLQAIEAACRDYAGGWFTADEQRVARAMHPELVKRTIWRDLQDNTMKVGKLLTAEAMVGYTRDGGGNALPEHEKAYEVTILDVFRDIASAKVSSYPYMDYLHLIKTDGRWQILNCLYMVRQGDENSP